MEGKEKFQERRLSVMAGTYPSGYAGKVLRIDLTTERISEERVDEATLRKYLGGTGFGAKILYDEVPPEVDWDHPENRIIFGLGPLNGIPVAGSGSYCVVTKGPLTGGGTSTQANGDFGAYLKFSGYDAVILQGIAKRWLYLYVHDNTAELRDATHLVGKDTYEIDDLIKKELGRKEKQLSVVGIGPGGENLVKFACIIGDKGHAAAHNGVGAVMGVKRLKAIAAARGNGKVEVRDGEKISKLSKEMIATWTNDPTQSQVFRGGTSFLMLNFLKIGHLPIKNLTTNVYSEEIVRKFTRQEYEKSLKMTPKRCWACPSHHLHMVEVTEGPYKGYVAEEPDYEIWSETSTLIDNKDVGASVMLGDTMDRLGLDGNESGWLISFVMECYEKGILTKQDTDGIEMTWGNVEAVREMLHKIANREGIGNILAEGVKSSAQEFGGEALNIAVYSDKGHAPRGHDHRPRWTEQLDYAVSSVGTIETGPIAISDLFDVDEVSTKLAKVKFRNFVDSLVMCMFPTLTMHVTPGSIERMVEMINAATGWDFTKEEADIHGQRVSHLMRVFNLRHGIGTDVERPSVRYGSTPTDGPAEGKGIMPHWDDLLDNYYKVIGWDRASGRPLPETLKKVDLEEIISDIW